MQKLCTITVCTLTGGVEDRGGGGGAAGGWGAAAATAVRKFPAAMAPAEAR